MTDRLKIYVCHYNPYKIINSDAFVNIQSGRAISNYKLDMVGDDTSDNISHLNPSYSELTSHYWVWKNDKDSDYIGFFHYRRYLSFKNIIKEQGTSISDIVENFGFKKDIYLEELKNCDIITPYLIITYPYKNIYDKFTKCFGGFCTDKLIEIIKIKYPNYSNAVDRFIFKEAAYHHNMYITKRKYFEEYASFMFDILESMEKICRKGMGNLYIGRLMGYLAEFLFNCYLEYAIEKYSITIKMAKPVRVIKLENGEYDFAVGCI